MPGILSWHTRRAPKWVAPATLVALIAGLMSVPAGQPTPALASATVGSAPCAQTVSNSSGVQVTNPTVDGRPTCQVHFTSPGTTTWTLPSGVTSFRVLTVGAGGGGGANAGGGGGGGAVFDGTITVPSSAATQMSITVGAGGLPGVHTISAAAGAPFNVTRNPPTAGSASSISVTDTSAQTLTVSAAGGAGGQYGAGATQAQGGAGGSVSLTNTSSILTASGNSLTGGAGGAGVAFNTQASGTSGANGHTVAAFPNNSYIAGAYGGGGGGGASIGADTHVGGAGGTGGGGAGGGGKNGEFARFFAVAGGANTGGGGGSGSAQLSENEYTIGSETNRSRNGRSGGSGVVVIRYDIPLAAVSNVTVNNIQTTTATVASEVTSFSNVTARGFVVATTTDPVRGGGATDVPAGTGTGSFTANLTGLTTGQTYYVRAYAENAGGVTYGPVAQFQTCSGFWSVTYNANADQHQKGAVNGTVPDQQVSCQAPTVAEPGTLTRTGFTFEGWNTQSDGDGTDYKPGDTTLPSGEVVLYAQWGIPEAARLFGRTEVVGGQTVRRETISPITTNGTVSLAGNIRGITTDGRSVFFVPSTASAQNRIVREVTLDGVRITDHTVTSDNSTALTAFDLVRTGQRDLTYSSGCIFFRESGQFADRKLYCISTSTWQVSEVTISGVGLLAGQGWLYGNLVDFPDGRIGAVSANNHATGTAGCPSGFFCKTLRVYTVDNSGTGSVTITFDRDIILADHENPNPRPGYTFGNGWPDDDHGIATDGTYLYQSRHASGYKVWGLQSSGPSYIVFNGDGTGTCGANDGVSGGLCPISFSKGGVTVVNATYFGRDHVSGRYLMGDFDGPRFVYTEQAVDQPASEFTIAAPGAPQSPTAEGGDSEVTVSWLAPGGNDPVTSYTVTAHPGGNTCTTASTSCTVTGLTNGTSYTFTVVASNNGGQGPASAPTSAVTPSQVPKIDQQALSFASAAVMEIGDTVTLSAVGGSGSGALSYAYVSGPCTLVGDQLTATGEGSCVVTATRDGDDTYKPRTTANYTITVSKTSQTISFTSSVPTQAVAGTTYTPTATATSGLSVSFTISSGSPEVCELADGTVTFKQSGTCVISASQSGNTTFAAATPITQTIVAGKINQTITFPAITGKQFGDPAFAAGATVSSGRAVAYASDTTAVCSVNASTGVVSIIAVGTCTITASSTGDTSFADASPVSRSFVVSPVLPGVPNITSVSFGSQSVTVAFVAPGENGGADIVGYQVVAIGNGQTITQPDCATTSPCTITGLTDGVDYTLTIQAINAAGIGPESDASPLVRPASVPNAITGLTTAPGNGQLVVVWDALTEAGLGGGTFTRYDLYIVERGELWGAPVAVDATNQLDAQATTTFTFTGLVNGTAYDVKIVAVTSANSQELVSNTVIAWGVPATIPEPPTALGLAALDNTTALASWSAPTDNGGAEITSYLTGLTCVFENPTDTFCTLSGLTPGATVTFSVGATNIIGTSSTVSATITMPGGSTGSGGGTTTQRPSRPAPRSLPTEPSAGGGTVGGNTVGGNTGRSNSTPSPAPSSQSSTTPLQPGGAPRATIAGAPVNVVTTPINGGNGVGVRAGSVQLNLTPNGGGSGSGSAPELRVPHGTTTTIAGGGLLPGSTLQVSLPQRGSSSLELGTLTVGRDGTVDAPVSFSNQPGQKPLPIGRQVIQMSGVDENGQVTVFEMTVNVAQGGPRPEPNLLLNALPALQAGESLATSAGIPETVTVTAIPERRQVDVTSGEWAFQVALPDGAGDVQRIPSGATITLLQSENALVSGLGFQPGTRVDVWLFSDPTLLDSFTVTPNGTFTGTVFLDPQFASIGQHTLQLQGVGSDGLIKAANLGVEVQVSADDNALATSAASLSLLWWALGIIAVTLLGIALWWAGSRRRSSRAV